MYQSCVAESCVTQLRGPGFGVGPHCSSSRAGGPFLAFRGPPCRETRMQHRLASTAPAGGGGLGVGVGSNEGTIDTFVLRHAAPARKTIVLPACTRKRASLHLG